MTAWLRIGVGLLLLAATATLGCRALALPILLWGKEPTKTVEAEYPYLADKRVALVVRADMETLVENPHVHHELADHVRVALERHVEALSTVEPAKVARYQRENADWETTDPATLGKRFFCDRLIEIVLTQYTTREPESPYLHRGYITALVNIYNTSYPNSAPAFSTEVRVVYPPEGPGEWGQGDREIRRATMEAFGEELAGRFYDREVKVQ